MDSQLISWSPDLSDQPSSSPIERPPTPPPRPPDHQHPPEDSLDLLGTPVMAMTTQGGGECTDDIVVSTGFEFPPQPDSLMSIQDSSLTKTLTPKLFAGGASGAGNNLYWKQAHYVPNAKDRCGRCSGCSSKTCMSKGSKMEEILEAHGARCCVNCADQKTCVQRTGAYGGHCDLWPPHLVENHQKAIFAHNESARSNYRKEDLLALGKDGLHFLKKGLATAPEQPPPPSYRTLPRTPPHGGKLGGIAEEEEEEANAGPFKTI